MAWFESYMKDSNHAFCIVFLQKTVWNSGIIIKLNKILLTILLVYSLS